MEEKFIEMIAEILEREEDSIKMSDNFRNYEEWDSLSVLSIMALIDEQYGLTISRNDFKKCQRLEDLYNYIMANKK